MKKHSLLLLLLVTFITISCQKEELPEPEKKQESSTTKKASISKLDIAKRWAPIHHMDVDATGRKSLKGKSDYITAIDFDGDWNATNNWDNIAKSQYKASAHCYYSVVETSTHWFITYAFFHPRDWENDFPFSFLAEHENDLEGALMIVEKNNTTYGELKGCVTVAHSDFFSFTPSSSNYRDNDEDIDGELTMQSFAGALHPVTAQECRGHGLKAHPKYKINGDGVIYYPSMNDVAEVPSDVYDNHVGYKLVDIFEPNGLWDQRYNTQLFKNEQGAFKLSHGRGGANAPWNWNDHNDNVERGEFATDPAKLVNSYFSNLGNFSFTYTNNPYRF